MQKSATVAYFVQYRSFNSKEGKKYNKSGLTIVNDIFM